MKKNSKLNFIKEKTKKNWSKFKKQYIIAFFVIVFLVGATIGYYYAKNQQRNFDHSEENIYVDFLSEIYNKILNIYWENLSEAELVRFFKNQAESIMKTQYRLVSDDQTGLKIFLTEIIKELNDNKKKEFTVKLANLVLHNLKPIGRNKIFNQQGKQELENLVKNINPQNNLYAVLGLNKDASEKDIKASYQKQMTKLKSLPDNSPKKQKKLQQINYAYNVLSHSEKKQKYDQAKEEPTVFSKIFQPNLFYIYIKRFSPTTLNEFIQNADKTKNQTKLDTLVLDLRGNIGGSINLLPYFLGPFIGQNQYAYEMFHKDTYVPFKTKIGWLPSLIKYKRVVILIDGQTQSTAELMTAVLKKYNVGVLVGTTTKGWGTVEKIIKLEHQIDKENEYSLVLVENLTLRDDNKPIEGNGVEPTINIKTANWQQQFNHYFYDPQLTELIEKMLQKKPLEIITLPL